MKRLGRSLMLGLVAAGFSIAAALLVAAVWSAFDWGDSRFVEGVVFTLTWLDTVKAQWLNRSLDRWWGMT